MLGDTIVDQYAACEAIGMSAEARWLWSASWNAKTSSVALQWWLLTSAPWEPTAISSLWWELTAPPNRAPGAGLPRHRRWPEQRSLTHHLQKRYVVENQKLHGRLEEHNLDAAVEDQVIAQLAGWLLEPMASLLDFVTGWSLPASWRLCSTCHGSTTCCSSGSAMQQPSWINHPL